MTARDQTRGVILNRVLAGDLTAAQAAEALTRSVRQVRRMLAAYRKEGAATLAHGNRGRSPVHALDPAVRARVATLATTTYAGLNDTHLTEVLAEREGIVISRASGWRIRRAAGRAGPRQRQPPRHRQRRERRVQAGMLLQLDGSHHAWLEERGPRLVLLAAIDDATGTVPAALFRAQEDAHGYLALLAQIVTEHGCPEAVYHDRHSIFVRSARERETLAEQLAGDRTPTQVGRALAEVGITSLQAHSPQAKGRIERLFGTLQDRLVAELRLAGATTLAQATAVLATFLPRFNAQFAVPAAQPGTAYRPVPATLDVRHVFCFKYLRTVGRDDTVRLGEHRLQLLPGRERATYARAQVEIHERLDGNLAVFYRGQLLASQPAPVEAPVLRARGEQRLGLPSTAGVEPPASDPGPPPNATAPAPKRPWKPPVDHPWRTPRQAKG